MNVSGVLVREDYSHDGDAWNFFTHDHARSRAYRWGEDGIAGISDDKQADDLFIQGAFQGITPKEAFFVKCDKETTTQNDINLGRVNIWVGFAPMKPAEFVIIYIQQIAGQILT